ncbi:MAG: 2-succinyl-5-enolpyruvyl-6-hydroxy-3-cyclohexene-1-carboxylic-acid synthase [Acidobacteria bacterium]|nr:2-succinyl-5-enolpyruvyl-6-hydroxy-3-cyclohexene-1-carboxylic-acid synthase [Acidobacteriota bacterium]
MTDTIDPHSTANAQATFCATLVDEWVRLGVKHAFLAPGSRSTPMALALAAEPRIRTEVFLDERGAGFAALGSALVSGVPAIALCTSGTAAAHFHAAVIEAHLSAVPMIVCTADRPPELRDVGAPQTINQTNLYGSAVRWFHDPGVASFEAAHTWRALANHLVARSVGPVPGPVHVNLPFREPLVGQVVDTPATRTHDGPWSGHVHAKALLTDWEIDDLAHRLVGRRGIIVAGDPGCGYAISAYSAAATVLASVLGWPLLACPRSGTRVAGGNIIGHFDGIVRSRAATTSLAPEVVLRLGAPPASKVLGQWLRAVGAEQVVVHSPGAYLDPDHVVEVHVEADVANTVDRLSTAVSRIATERSAESLGAWSASWQHAEAAAASAIHVSLDGGDLLDPHVAREVAANSRILFASSSMPIRDIEWFAATGEGLLVYANRGANGIDGVVATAIGAACELQSITVYLGDVALVHDASSLAMLAQRDLDVRVVVTDNDGGAIFSYLPQASTVEAARFEKLFGTPHGSNLSALASAFGLRVNEVSNVQELRDAISASGPSVTVVRTDRGANHALHGKLNAAITEAVDAALASSS